MAANKTRQGAGTVDIGQLRLTNQRILGSSFRKPVDVVRWMLAMQAQDFSAAKWAMGLRTDPKSGVSDAHVEAALATGEIVRSWPMRGTLHFVPGEDLNWMLSLTTPRLIAGAASRRAALELDDATLERAREIAGSALADGGVLTREQMMAVLDEGGVSTAGQRGYHILWFLSQTGTLCFGPPRGKEQTFVLLEDWVKKPRRLEREEALGEWARRYFVSHGPATVKDFAWWTKLTAAEVKVGVALARPHLVQWEVGGVIYLMGPEAEQLLAGVKPEPSRSLFLLPGFDEYLLGYQDRGAVLAEHRRDRIVPGGNGVFLGTIVAAGKVVGTWRRLKKGKENVVVPELFATLSRAQRESLEVAVRRYGAFLGIEVSLQSSSSSGAGTAARSVPAKPAAAAVTRGRRKPKRL